MWNRMTIILIREGGRAAGVRIFFKSVEQAVLLLVSDTCVVTPHMGRSLGGVPVPGGVTDDGADTTVET